MFLKQDKPEMDGFEKEEKNGYKGKYSIFLENCDNQVFNGYPCKNITKYYIPLPPPLPFADAFFDVLPLKIN